MKHEIVKFTFGLKGNKGWHICHRNRLLGVSITPNSGDFLLFMAGMPCGMCLPGSSVKSIELVEKGQKFSLFVNYVGREGLPDQYDGKLLIGWSKDLQLLDIARRFVESINLAFYMSNDPNNQNFIAFRKERQSLLRTNSGEYVAYHQGIRLELGSDRNAVYQKARERIPVGLILIGHIIPDEEDLSEQLRTEGFGRTVKQRGS